LGHSVLGLEEEASLIAQLLGGLEGSAPGRQARRADRSGADRAAGGTEELFFFGVVEEDLGVSFSALLVTAVEAGQQAKATLLTSS
jgi:hypothetical protein